MSSPAPTTEHWLKLILEDHSQRLIALQASQEQTHRDITHALEVFNTTQAAQGEMSDRLWGPHGDLPMMNLRVKSLQKQVDGHHVFVAHHTGAWGVLGRVQDYFVMALIAGLMVIATRTISWVQLLLGGK